MLIIGFRYITSVKLRMTTKGNSYTWALRTTPKYGNWLRKMLKLQNEKLLKWTLDKLCTTVDHKYLAPNDYAYVTNEQTTLCFYVQFLKYGRTWNVELVSYLLYHACLFFSCDLVCSMHLSWSLVLENVVRKLVGALRE